MAACSRIWKPPPERHPCRGAKRTCLAHGYAAFAAAVVAALVPLRASASIARTGFQNEYYQGLDYNGSRVLEQLEVDRYEEYLEVTWTQSVVVDARGQVWVADRDNHVIVEMPPSTRYVPWAALYLDYAGTRGMPGFMDGSRKQVRFDSPSGLVATVSLDPLYLYISDTNNHVVRRVDTRYERIITLVGKPQEAGMRDGSGGNARLRFPQSLGLDQTGDNLMVLDNGRRIRHVKVNLAVPTITTLVDGSCRSISRYTMLTSIEFRTVGCHTDWSARDTDDNGVELHRFETICLGHQATCGPRDHPAISDQYATQLRAEPTTTTSTTTSVR
jgi:hypothetical protein